jgi:hypothetical protein
MGGDISIKSAAALAAVAAVAKSTLTLFEIFQKDYER